MKNLLLLISVILSSSFSVAGDTSPEEIYAAAKRAYIEPDCEATIYYLRKYLEVTTAKEEKLESINIAINWCTKFLDKGVIISRISGLIGPSRSFKKVTKEGKEMLKVKPEIPNK